MNKREEINNIISILLIFTICITGILGYLQSQFELRKFVPHRYFAYATLSLATLHVYLNWGKVWCYLRRKLNKRNK